jgi:microcystin-dependent protein
VNSITVTSSAATIVQATGLSANNGSFNTFDVLSGAAIGAVVSSGNNNISVTSSGTGGGAPAHSNLQPTVICNYIIRII